jgi:hypothetical protein
LFQLLYSHIIDLVWNRLFHAFQMETLVDFHLYIDTNNCYCINNYKFIPESWMKVQGQLWELRDWVLHTKFWSPNSINSLKKIYRFVLSKSCERYILVPGSMQEFINIWPTKNLAIQFEILLVFCIQYIKMYSR